MPDTVELEYQGRPIIVTGDTAPLHPYRGFFSGDDWDPHGAHPPDASGRHPADVTVEYEGQVFDLHRTTDGDLHSHDLPTRSFSSIEAAAETIAEFVDQKLIRGRPAQPEQP